MVGVLLKLEVEIQVSFLRNNVRLFIPLRDIRGNYNEEESILGQIMKVTGK